MRERIASIATAIIVAIGFIYPVTAHAAGTYNITYINNGVSTTRAYAAGSTVTLDSLPAGAIAWTDDNDPDAPNGKMAYVSYDNRLTISRNMTLTADYGSYAGGAPGPRLIQYHLELKYYEPSISAFMEFQQQYNSVTAPAGYYIHLPDENYFDPIEFTTNPPVTLDTALHIHKWVYDASYTGGSVADPTLLHDPNSLILVDPNNYNQIYNVMVDPSYDVEPPGPGVNPVVLPSALPRNAVQFTVSQRDLPDGGGFTADGNSYTKTPGNDTSQDTYLQRPVNGLTWENAFSSNPPTTTYDLLPTVNDISGYTWSWIRDDTAPTISTITSTGNSLTITASHAYILQYTPTTPQLDLTVTVNRNTVVWDGQPHTVAGYTVNGLEAGDRLVYSPLTGATDSVTQTDVGSYPLNLAPEDFYVEDSGGNVLPDKYNISVIGGGLTILPTTSDVNVNPGGGNDLGLGGNESVNGAGLKAPDTGAGREHDLSMAIPILISAGAALIMAGCRLFNRS